MRHISVLIASLLLTGCDGQQQADVGFDQVSSNTKRHGERIAKVLGCIGCHGNELTGKDWSSPGFATMWTSNLSVELPKYDDMAFQRALQKGIRRDGSELWDMPSFLFSDLSESDLSALTSYLRSVPSKGASHPRPIFMDQARKEMAEGIYKSSAVEAREKNELSVPDTGEQHRLGRYIVRATCAECHGMDLRGGVPYPNAQPRPDIRMVAAYDKSDFVKFMKTGKAAGNRELQMMSDAARGRYSHLTPEEVNAVYDFLGALAKADP